MRILLHSATRLEVEPLLSHFEEVAADEYRFHDHRIKLLISGVGMMATAYHLGKRLAIEEFDLAINAGICGSLEDKTEVGQAVFAATDQAIEEGAEDGEQWLSLEKMKLRASDDFPYEEGRLRSSLAERLAGELDVPLKQAISVNRVLGAASSIVKVKRHSKAEIVSMEGAAFYFSCLMKGLACLQVRAISNRVEERNRAAWRVEMALANLTSTLLKVLKHV